MSSSVDFTPGPKRDLCIQKMLRFFQMDSFYERTADSLNVIQEYWARAVYAQLIKTTDCNTKTAIIQEATGLLSMASLIYEECKFYSGLSTCQGYLGDLWRITKKIPLALSFYNRALKSWPECGRTYGMIGICLAERQIDRIECSPKDANYFNVVFFMCKSYLVPIPFVSAQVNLKNFVVENYRNCPYGLLGFLLRLFKKNSSVGNSDSVFKINWAENPAGIEHSLVVSFFIWKIFLKNQYSSDDTLRFFRKVIEDTCSCYRLLLFLLMKFEVPLVLIKSLVGSLEGALQQFFNVDCNNLDDKSIFLGASAAALLSCVISVQDQKKIIVDSMKNLYAKLFDSYITVDSDAQQTKWISISEKQKSKSKVMALMAQRLEEEKSNAVSKKDALIVCDSQSAIEYYKKLFFKISKIQNIIFPTVTIENLLAISNTAQATRALKFIEHNANDFFRVQKWSETNALPIEMQSDSCSTNRLAECALWVLNSNPKRHIVLLCTDVSIRDFLSKTLDTSRISFANSV